MRRAAVVPADLVGLPAVLKTRKLGYDGKGQVMLSSDSDLAEAWARMGAKLGILEGFVDFSQEISVILARGIDGKALAFPAVENRHRNHILDTTTAPAKLPASVLQRADAIAHQIAEAIDVIGLLAVEMFVTDQARCW